MLYYFTGPNPSNTADKGGNLGNSPSDPLDPEQKTFYENLPFHGMQNPPNKVRVDYIYQITLHK